MLCLELRWHRSQTGPEGGGALCPPPSEPTPRPLCPQINLNKGDEYWWNAILEGEEQIDIDKINKERSMATVDEEEHAVLDRLTFDYHQKLQGKPQSHELVGAPPPSTAPGGGRWAPRLPPCLGCGRRRGPAAPRPPWAWPPVGFAIFLAKKWGFVASPSLTGAAVSLQKVHEMLKKGWDTEGSPFRGQKFDPSMFNISPGAVQF